MAKSTNTPAKTGSAMQRFADSRAAKILLFIASLFGAFLLWIYAMGYDSEATTQVFTGIPVELTGTNAGGYTVAETDFSLSIDVTASGTRSELSSVTSADFRAYVDISGVSGAGYNTLPIHVVEPNALNVTHLSTANVTLYIDKFTTKRIPVLVEQVYQSSYTIGETAQSVNQITVYGPETLLSNAEAYALLDLGTVTDTAATGSGAIRLRDASTKTAISSPYITMDTQTVSVTYTMYASRTLPLRLNLTGGMLTPEDIQYAFGSASLTLYGPAALLNSLESLAVSVDETSADTASEMTFDKQELLAANGLDARVTPEEPDTPVTLTLSIPATRTADVQVPASHITVVNLPNHVSISVQSALTVRILGEPAAVKGYDSNRMTAKIDYYSLELQPSSGLYLGTATVETGDSAVCVYGGPYTVVISVSGS
ncbi:MAG: hypothetical protein J5843_01475 [Clostridia bacterium]|nr:hypothetical protein [Clostridia bacterium]